MYLGLGRCRCFYSFLQIQASRDSSQVCHASSVPATCILRQGHHQLLALCLLPTRVCPRSLVLVSCLCGCIYHSTHQCPQCSVSVSPSPVHTGLGLSRRPGRWDYKGLSVSRSHQKGSDRTGSAPQLIIMGNTPRQPSPAYRNLKDGGLRLWGGPQE